MCSENEAFFHGAQVSVTGATGFLGSHLVRRLLSCGARVTVLVRDPTKLAPDIVRTVCTIQGDLLDSGATQRAVQDAEFIFHCAANVATWDRRDAYDSVNVQGVQNLLSGINVSSQTRLKRLVHVSTLDVYGFPDLPANETSPTPVNRFGYGESKRVGEELLRAECIRLGLPYSVIRPGNIVGPGSPFISRIGKELVSGLMLKIDGGDIHAGLIEVQNLVDVLLWSAISPNALGEVFNVRDPHNVTWGEFIYDLRNRLGGRGFVFNLGYLPAMVFAHLIGGVHSGLRLSGEPLLHPLIVKIFGKTCGHSVDRLRASGAPLGQIDYHTSLERSVTWFTASQKNHE